MQGHGGAGSEEIRHHFGVGLGRGRRASFHEKRPEPVPDFGGQHAFEILEGSPPKAAVLAVEAAESDLERLTWENQSSNVKTWARL